MGYKRGWRVEAVNGVVGFLRRARENGRVVIVATAILVSLFVFRKLLGDGVLGYAYDWNVPITPDGLRHWAIADLMPWRPIEFGMPLAYPTELYLKLAAGSLGFLGLGGATASVIFLISCLGLAFVGVARLLEDIFEAPLFSRLIAGTLYVTSPVIFDVTITGYLTFLLSYAMLPWVLVATFRAVKGKPRAWPMFALTLAISMAQVQYAAFSFGGVVALLIALRASLRQWGAAAAWGLAGIVGSYLFIIGDLLANLHEVSTIATWSAHSWTELSAPGVLGASFLVPSVYPFFDQSLGNASWFWHILALCWVAVALIIGVRSKSRVARVLAVCVVLLIVIPLNGANPPLGIFIKWAFQHVPFMLVFRNINYFFGPLVLILCLLPFAPVEEWPYSASRSVIALAFVIVFPWPMWKGNFGGQLTLLRGKNPVTSVVGEDDRALVLPFPVPVVDDRRSGPSGINIAAVETISPVFVRDTPAGSYAASVLDRLTDWAPIASDGPAFLRIGRLGSVILQSGLSSKYPDYVNSYQDLWLKDAYATSAIVSRLDSMDLPLDTQTGNRLYKVGSGDDFIGASTAVAEFGSTEEAAAAFAAGVQGVFIPAEQIPQNALATQAVGALVRTALMPPLLPSRRDIRDGAALELGRIANGPSADFHAGWVGLLESQNWWLSSRLMQVPHAAITDKPMAALTVHIPPGPRHLFLQYFTSFFSSRLFVEYGGRKVTLDAATRSFGMYQWADLGSIGANDPHELSIVSQSRLNAVGILLMLSPDEERADRGRLASVKSLPTVVAMPDVTIPGVQRFSLPEGTGPVALVLSRPSKWGRIVADAWLRNNGRDCQVEIANGQPTDFALKLDGEAPSSGGVAIPLAQVPCSKGQMIVLSSFPLTSTPRRIAFHSQRVELQVVTAGRDGSQTTVDRTLALPGIPLAFPVPAPGDHVMTFELPSLLPGGVGEWSNVEDAEMGAPGLNVSAGRVAASPVGVTIALRSNNHAIDVHAMLRPLEAGASYLFSGPYRAVGGTMDITLFDMATHRIVGDQLLSPSVEGATFHLAVRSQTSVAEPLLYVHLHPYPAQQATGELTLATAGETLAANLLAAPATVFTALAARPLIRHSLGFERYAISGNNIHVIEYAQTYDPLWEIDRRGVHIQSTAGFNAWLLRRSEDGGTISYRTGILYPALVVASFLEILLLVVGAIGTAEASDARSLTWQRCHHMARAIIRRLKERHNGP